MPVTWTSFFNHPLKSAVLTWATSSFILFIPTCLELVPLGKDKDKKEKSTDDAEKKYNKILRELNRVNQNINKSRQDILDLNCTIAGHLTFNQGITDFQRSINDSALVPIDLLKSLWKIEFEPDRESLEQSSKIKSWSEEKTRMVLINKTWMTQTYTVTHHYNEITTIQNSYQNIIHGIPFSLPALECGDYSRRFGISSPVTYRVNESRHNTHGKKEDGAIYITFNRTYGSNVTSFYDLDRDTESFNAPVLREADQKEAATDLATKLYHFLATAIAAFNMAGANYSEIQGSIINKIPKLLENATALNVTLTEQALTLEKQKTGYDEAENEYNTGLSIWLPLLLGAPLVLSLLVYGVLKCKNRSSSNDIEPEVASSIGMRM